MKTYCKSVPDTEVRTDVHSKSSSGSTCTCSPYFQQKCHGEGKKGCQELELDIHIEKMNLSPYLKPCTDLADSEWQDQT